ncbi:MAG: hypothetical protein ACK5R0_22470, partial [Bacteroidota bacterium]
IGVWSCLFMIEMVAVILSWASKRKVKTPFCYRARSSRWAFALATKLNYFSPTTPPLVPRNN